MPSSLFLGSYVFSLTVMKSPPHLIRKKKTQLPIILIIANGGTPTAQAPGHENPSEWTQRRWYSWGWGWYTPYSCQNFLQKMFSEKTR